MGVDAYRRVEQTAHVAHRLADFAGQSAPIGVTQHDPIRAALRGGPKGSESVIRVSREAVEELLGVVDDFASVGFQEAHGIADHLQVGLPIRAENLLHVERPALAEDSDDGGLTVQ